MTGLWSSWLAVPIVLAAGKAPATIAAEGDIVLDRALRPRSGQTVDCGGRTLRGAPVLMYLLDVQNVTVTETLTWDCIDCPISHIDYGFATDLSLNYWGPTCEPAFVDSDLTGLPAYAAPVAAAYRAAAAAGGTIDPAALGPLCE